MEYKDINTEKNDRPVMLFTLSLMAVLLHQSSVIFGVNMSLADLFCFAFLFIIAGKKNLVVPVKGAVFFFIVSIVVFISAYYIVPLEFSYYPRPVRVAGDYMKLAAVFLYFLAGYNLAKEQDLEWVFKWYAFFAAFIGGIGLFLTVVKIDPLISVFYFAEIRFKGLMNDPNYFALLQITAFVYFSRSAAIPSPVKGIAFFLIIFSVLISGSKTGFITIAVYFIFRFMEYVFLLRKKAGEVIAFLLILFFFTLLSPYLINNFSERVDSLAHSIPALSRIGQLVTDADGAISGNGSERGDTWKTAVNLIQSSPLFGVGIGTYSSVAYRVNGVSDIAHNTFLQLAAEWGIPLAAVLFSYMFYTVGRAAAQPFAEGRLIHVMKDMLIVFLIGSMAVSLNNARMLWFIFGALLSVFSRMDMEKKGGLAETAAMRREKG